MFLKIKNSIFKILIELFIFDKDKRSRIKSRWAKRHLKKYADFAIKNLPKEISQEETPEYIFQYWHQGFNNAPVLIKKCVESLKKYHPDKNIVLLNYETIKDYIELPARYYDLLSKGKIPLAHFSDVLRTYLLAQYGGLWVDSTIYFTGKIPEEIFKSDFFVLSKDETKDWLENNMSNYFIRSKAGNKIINALKLALDGYWEENDFVINYFMYEHIATILSKTETLKEEWDKMPCFSAVDTGLLLTEMNKDYDKKVFDEIKSKTNMHKLSYKRVLADTSGKSYYDKIIKNEI